MSDISLYFPPISAVNEDPSFRVICHINNIYADMFTTDFLFYIDSANILFPWTSGTTQYYMTLFHISKSDSTQNGWQICLVKRPNNNNYEIGIRYNQHSDTWTELTDSFYEINILKPYMVMFQYHILNNSQPSILNFYVTEFDSIITKTEPDISYNLNKSVNDGFPDVKITDSASNLSFGSSPENASTNYGLITTKNYNSYQAQSTYMKYMRTWNYLVPETSDLEVYSLFNTINPTYSLLSLNINNTVVPNTHTNSQHDYMQFQLYITAVQLSNVYNYSINRQQLITQLTTLTNVTLDKLLDGYSYALDSVQSITENVFCLLEGTEILTPTGSVLIENLKIGDNVITHDGRVVKITHKDTSTICRFMLNKNNIPVVIKKGYYNAYKDLYLSPGHAILINDIYKCALNNIENIESCGEDFLKNHNPIIYYHIGLENYYTDTIVANGVTVECLGTCGHDGLDTVTGEIYKRDDNYYNEMGLRFFKTIKNRF
jgi:hypothetical protein